MELVDPNGDTGVLWDGPSETGALTGRLVPHGGISGDDQVNGRWLLRVTNLDGGGSGGNLHGWTLDLVSRWD